MKANGAQHRNGVTNERRIHASGSGLAALTEREGDVLAGLCAGLRDKEIAERLVVSPATVATHVRSIASKLGVRSRLEIVVHTFTRRPPSR